MPCCKHIIADYVPHIPWIEDLRGTLISFCPIVSQNPTLSGFRGKVMPCCKHIIADYVPHIPWIEDLVGTLISFCPIVSQNPTLDHIVVSVLP